MFENLKEYLKRTQLVLGTLSIVIASIIGTYTFVTEYFVTKSYAKELETNIQTMIRSVQTQTQQNSIMIIEMKLTDYERRIEKGEKLTPTEQRQYQRLLLEYNSQFKETQFKATK